MVRNSLACKSRGTIFAGRCAKSSCALEGGEVLIGMKKLRGFAIRVGAAFWNEEGWTLHRSKAHIFDTLESALSMIRGLGMEFRAVVEERKWNSI